MKKIGLIGGLSWVSTAAYYRRLNEITQERLGGVHSAELVLASVDREDYVQAVIHRRDEEAACRIILAAAQSVERAGADFIVICCNDVHRFVPRIEPALSIPFLHIAEATARKIAEHGLGAVALMGVRKTMEETFYPDVLARFGIATLIPDEAERTYIHDTIYDELVKDVFRDETRARYVDIMRNLQRRGAEGIILGCTEIPLLVSEGDAGLPTFSTTEIHCQASVSRAID